MEMQMEMQMQMQMQNEFQTLLRPILQKCNQTAPIQFQGVLEGFSNIIVKGWTKCSLIVGVLDDYQRERILKVYTCQQNQPEYLIQINSELTILKALSSAHKNQINRCTNFISLEKSFVLEDAIPLSLQWLINLYLQDTYDFKLDLSQVNYFVIFQMYPSAKSLLQYTLMNEEQAKSIIIQTSLALAVAENIIAFEHRNLYLRNILINETTEATIPFTLCSRHILVNSHGIKVVLCSFTYSRATVDNVPVYTDMNMIMNEEFNEPLNSMQMFTLNDWSRFTPKTNLIWMNYLINYFLSLPIFSFENSNLLKEWELLSKNVESANDFVFTLTYLEKGCMNPPITNVESEKEYSLKFYKDLMEYILNKENSQLEN